MASLAPALATLVKVVPEGADWLHEVKYDGYRILCHVADGAARLYSRNGHDWTARMQGVADAAARLKLREAWLDGEVCVVDGEGHSSFQALQNALSDHGRSPMRGEGRGRQHRLTYFVFDLPYLDGLDLRGARLDDRKRLLEARLTAGAVKARPGAGPSDAILYSGHVLGSGRQVFSQACKAGLEGVVCKRVGAPYREGRRGGDWVKVKCIRRQEMVIGGFTDPRGARIGFGALLLGVYEGRELRYAGKVGTGFDDQLLLTLRRTLDGLEQPSAPFSNPPRGYEARGAHWVKPELVAEVAFTEWSEDGALRHPSFQGLREDKKAREVVREEPRA